MPSTLVDRFLHLDNYLSLLATEHSAFVYVLLFAVLFIETGIVVMPFLPGDSLLFVAGALAAKGVFSLALLVPLLTGAAVLGDSTNYAIGRRLHGRIETGHRLRFIKSDHLVRTQSFFVRHGRKTILIARYVPIVRTLAPFVAALGSMQYGVFLTYNVAGGFLWVMSLLGAGYAFGNVPWVGANLTDVLVGIIALSLLPGVVGWIRAPGSENVQRKP